MSINSPQIHNSQFFAKQNYYTSPLDTNFQDYAPHNSNDISKANAHNSHPNNETHQSNVSTPLSDSRNSTASEHPQSYEDFTNTFTSITGLNLNFNPNQDNSTSTNNSSTNNTTASESNYITDTVSDAANNAITSNSASAEVDSSQPPEQPFYVNAKQYHRILKRRIARAKLEESLKVARGRKPYLHESRHKHAMRRPRGQGGRFLTAAEIAERERLEKEKNQQQKTPNDSNSEIETVQSDNSFQQNNEVSKKPATTA